MRPVLFTDLDRTLLWSHRFTPEGPRIWVEYLHGRPQSWMTERTWAFFLRQTWLTVVPLTTRTRAQYQRLEKAFSSFAWSHALLCNGAMLLSGGEEDLLWREESLALAAPARDAFQTALDLACTLAGEENVVCTAPFQFYLKGAPSDAVCTRLERETDCSRLTVLRDTRKLYCFPSVFHKGTASLRYVRRFGGGPVFAAGDSLFDVPMLQCADHAFCPQSLVPLLPGAAVNVCSSFPFSDDLCAGLDECKRIEDIRRA